ncbi:MAG TPA: S8/S53 family peptidase [Bdellovibrionota bacterium]|nr:S8/S53 family peptidase [Bdellovibrionota bacterium]
MKRVLSFACLAASVVAVQAHADVLGLSDQEIQAIRDATGGEVDFGRALGGARDDRGPAPYPGTLVEIPGREVRASDRESVDGDPDFKDEWWVRNLKIQDAWKIATGNGVTVADCDAGYYWDQPDFSLSMLLDLRYDLADNDNHLKIDDGNFVGHGTAVAALIAGARDGHGTNGIAFDAHLIPFQNFNYDSSIDDMDKEEATAQCILRAIKQPGVGVITLENQTYEGSSETYAGTREAVRLALKAGILIVSAAGNSGEELKAEAGDDTGSLIIGSLKKDGSARADSNYGSRVAVATYGEDITTIYGPNGKLGWFGGTSGATALMGGMTALIREANPALTPEQIKELLIRTRVESAETTKVGGAVNIVAALQGAKGMPVSPAPMRKRHKFREWLRKLFHHHGA